MAGGTETRGHICLLSVAHDLADARLHRLVEGLLGAGAQVTVHGLGSETDGPTGAKIVARRRGSARRRLFRAVMLPFRVPADVLVVVDPDLFLPAIIAGRLRRLPIVCDVHEDYRNVVDDRGWARGRIRRFLARAAAATGTWAASRASLTVVADEHVRPATGRRRLVVRNLPRLAATATRAEAVPHAAYVGDVRISRGALRMIEAVVASPPWELDIVGPVNSDEREQIEEAAGRSSRVRLHGRLPSEASWELVRPASVGLSILDSTPSFLEAMPTKVYEYAAAGMAVVTSPLPRPAAVVENARMGAVVTGADDFTAILSGWHADPAELLNCCRRASEWAASTLGAEWPFDRAAQSIVELLDKRTGS